MAAPLPNKIRRYVTMQLAEFRHPVEVQQNVLTEFGIEVSRQRIQGYDPTKYQGRGLAKGLCELFWATRDEYVTDEGKQALAHRAERLRRLDDLYYRALAKGRIKDAISAIAVSGRDMGDRELVDVLKPEDDPK